jgi:hypothetical protein
MMSLPPVRATVRNDDPGGQIGEHLAKLRALRIFGSNIVDGTCASACTMLLGTIPPDRICAIPRETLVFHSAWNGAPTGDVISGAGNQILWSSYPASSSVRQRREIPRSPQRPRQRGRPYRSWPFLYDELIFAKIDAIRDWMNPVGGTARPARVQLTRCYPQLSWLQRLRHKSIAVRFGDKDDRSRSILLDLLP